MKKTIDFTGVLNMTKRHIKTTDSQPKSITSEQTLWIKNTLSRPKTV